MNIIEFGNFLSHPQDITEEHTSNLENILDDFPYFQAAHFLYLNGLKNQNSFKYNNELKITATYTTDRSVMFDYIASSDFNNRLQTEALSLSKVSSVDEISFSEIKDGQIERKSVEVKELSDSLSTLPTTGQYFFLVFSIFSLNSIPTSTFGVFIFLKYFFNSELACQQTGWRYLFNKKISPFYFTPVGMI